MDNYGCTWNSFEAKDRYLDTVQYALHAGGQRFESSTAHHFFEPRIPGTSPLLPLIQLFFQVVLEYCPQ